jgi:D-alanyl-D-alanine carboxypeptidase
MAGDAALNPILAQRLRTLGINEAACAACQLPPQDEAADLVQGEPDLFGRTQYMTPATATAWHRMREQARSDRVTLHLISAFRSVDYQCRLIEQKLADGRTLPEILRVNAIPGFSEHHTGRALDLGTDEVEPLTLAFEQTPAFDWLTRNAHRFDFHMSFPRDNPFDIDYEPWHWMHQSG